MKTKLTLIALAASTLVAAPAFAEGDYYCDYCDAATASVFDLQIGAFNSVDNNNVTNSASVNNKVLRDASGNIGLNVAAGSNNQQANAAAIADAQFSFGGAAASIVAIQGSGYNNTTDGYWYDYYWYYGTTNTASMNDQALKNVKGNVGVNIAAGDGNQQKNDLATANASNWYGYDYGDHAEASTEAYQVSWGNTTSSWDTSNTASMNDCAMKNASGNIGVNIAAGSGNQQFNGLSLASSH